MAKKQLASLINGIMGDDNQVPRNEDKREVTTPTEKRVGRPKKQESDDIRATFIVSGKQMMKIKYISLVSHTMQKDILHDALQRYIDDWEREHGEINLPT